MKGNVLLQKYRNVQFMNNNILIAKMHAMRNDITTSV